MPEVWNAGQSQRLKLAGVPVWRAYCAEWQEDICSVDYHHLRSGIDSGISPTTS
jgi:hypothetical protein